MAPTPQAVAHQTQREALAAATARAVLATWSEVDPNAVARSWAYLLDRVTAIVQAGQLTAARQTTDYMYSLLGPEAVAVAPEAFATQAPDGLLLAGSLALAIPATLGAINAGAKPVEAMARGAALLDMISRTVVADTGRQADQVAMVATPAVTSYVRVLELPSCARCIILAGREYGVSKGFLRHPRCDCSMEPVTLTHKPTPILPDDVVAKMSPEQRRKVFGEAGAKAIGDGADISAVVNARKGMATVERHGHKIRATTEGVSSRGHAGRQLGNFAKEKGKRYRTSQSPRLMPEEIYKQADDREHAIRLLRKNGYIY